jgi:hypothetical protein
LPSDIYFWNLPPFSTIPESNSFVAGFKKAYDVESDKSAALGAAALQVWARAVEQTMSLDRKTVAEAICGKTIKGTVFGDAAFCRTDKCSRATSCSRWSTATPQSWSRCRRIEFAMNCPARPGASACRAVYIEAYFPVSNEHCAPPPAFCRISLGSTVQLSFEKLSMLDPAAPSADTPAVAAVA